VREELARRLAAAAGAEAFVRDGAQVDVVADPAEEAAIEEMSASIEAQSAGWPEGATITTPNWAFRRLQAGEETFGVAGWRRDRAPPRTRESHALIEVLIDTAAAAVARVRLTAAKADAESRARTEDLRNALLSSISHDARTPLAAILASATSLQEFGDVLDAPTRLDLASTIQEEAVRLDAFVANLLHMSRLEAGALGIACSPFNVPEVVNTVVARRGLGAEGAVALEIAPNLPEALGDSGLFAQALGNVVENALRYGDVRAGPIRVLASAGEGEVRVEVRDRGPGVAEAELPRIFEKFYRAASAGPASGTGLGLSITRGLVEAMGGRVSAHNVAGPRGLSVTVALPVAA